MSLIGWKKTNKQTLFSLKSVEKVSTELENWKLLCIRFSSFVFRVPFHFFSWEKLYPNQTRRRPKRIFNLKSSTISQFHSFLVFPYEWSGVDVVVVSRNKRNLKWGWRWRKWITYNLLFVISKWIWYTPTQIETQNIVGDETTHTNLEIEKLESDNPPKTGKQTKAEHERLEWNSRENVCCYLIISCDTSVNVKVILFCVSSLAVLSYLYLAAFPSIQTLPNHSVDKQQHSKANAI